MLTRFNSSPYKVHIPAISLFVCTWISAFLLSLQGINFGDMGYYLTNQYWLVEDFQTYIFSDSRFVIFTNLVGGAWLHLAPAPTLLWAVLGGSLVYAATATFVYLTVRVIFPKINQFFPLILTFTIFLLTLSLCSTMVAKTLDTYTFPALIITIFFYLLAVWLFRPMMGKTRMAYCAVLGLMLTLIIFSRMNLILFVLLLLSIFLFTLYRPEPWRLFNKQELLILIIGMCISACILFILPVILSGIDLVNFFIHFTPTGREETHSLGILMSKYVHDLGYILAYAGIATGLFTLLRRTKEPDRSFVIASMVSFITFLLLCLLTFRYGEVYYLISNTQMNFFLAALSTAVFACFLLDHRGTLRDMWNRQHTGGMPDTRHTPLRKEAFQDQRTYHLVLIFFLTLTAALMGCIGSGAGFLRAMYGISLPACISGMIVLQWISDADRSAGRMRVQPGAIEGKYPLVFLAFICMTLMTGFIFYEITSGATDSPRPRLTEPFSHPSLALMHSTPDRVAVVDDLLFTLDRYNITGKKVLFLNAIPLFYHLTRTEPAYYQNPNPRIRSKQVVNQWQREIEQNSDLPEYVIIAKNYPDRYWPLSTRGFTKEKYLENRYAQGLGYSRIWESSSFIMYGRPIY